jgi:lysyl-tRNA synthetase class 2
VRADVLAPSDLAAPGPHRVYVPDAEAVRVGGRIVVRSIGAERELALSDAFATIPIAGDALGDLAHGDLAVIEGEVRGASLVSARIVARRAGDGSSAEVGRFRDAGVGALLAQRARASAAVRDHFERERFVEIDPPLAVPSPGLDLHLDAFELAAGARYLITSPEYQMKRLLVGGIPRCFALARCFRKGESGGRHNPEFTMLEWYRAHAGMDAMIADTENVVRAVAHAFGRRTLAVGDAEIEIDAPFRRLTVTEAFHDIASVAEDEMLRLAIHDEEQFFRILVDQVEPALAAMPVPVVLHRYPAGMASLARLDPDDVCYAERFEVYAGGVELSNGFVELTDPTEQRARLERDQRERNERGLPVYPTDERFLAALGEGMPDAAGNALGFDRLVMLASGRGRIGDVIAFADEDL